MAHATPDEGDRRLTIERRTAAGDWVEVGETVVLNDWQCQQIGLILADVDPGAFEKLSYAEKVDVLARLLDFLPPELDAAPRGIRLN